MARCGRCGLWNKYPEDNFETKYAGVCMWYQWRLPEHEVYERRYCPDFFEKMPDVSPMKHFEYKIQRDSLRDTFIVARRSKIISLIAIITSVSSFLFNLYTYFL